MPRTKRARRHKQEEQPMEESDLLIRDFERQAHMRILKMEAEAKMAIKSLETFIDVTLSRLPAEIRKMTLGEILSYESDNEVSSSVDDYSLPSVSTTAKGKKTVKRITTASDDGYVTEGVATTHTSRAMKPRETASTRRTRSSSRNSKMKLSEINKETVKKVTKKERVKRSINVDNFKTPAVLKVDNNQFSLVTPKVKPNTPLNVLRRPRRGEMVLSMQGSPLLVSAIVQDETANINVPLRNGNVISLLPNDGLRMSHIPPLDAETMKQLETLKCHIEKVISAK
ncbi:Borealin [Habropoda laboriosa]|uniref:Borealin n=1 Tax=Habropoda laboriosa TaxID=597456 RepID=A0A0L7R6S2_9HYME|nr:PREDICTED: borealin [Habropoda laboriosa]KOC66451.1 Borealin [Habropoda laboriosa]